MIKIIYRDLSPGLHASAETAGRDTIISLLPGLTPEQRRAALRRIRHSGRMGHGPRVSAVQLGLALGLDRIKAITRTGAAVVRLHPAGSTIPVLLLSTAAVVFVLMATVSIHVVPAPKSSDQTPVIGGLVHGPSASAPQAGQVPAPPDGAAGLPANGGTGHRSRPSAQGGSAAAQGSPAADTPGATVPGSLTRLGGAGSAGLDATSSVNPGLIGTRSAAASAGSAGSRGSGTVSQATSSGSGSASSGSGSSSPGTSSRPASGSSSGSGSSGASGTGGGRSSGSGAGSGGTSGAGTGGSGGSGTGTGSSGGGGTTGSGSGSSGSSGGSASSGSGSTGGSGSSGSSGGSSSGSGTCITVLVVQACLGL